MPVSVANFFRSGPAGRVGSKLSFAQRLLSSATSLSVSAMAVPKAPGGLRMFMIASLRLEAELLDHRAPAIDLAADENAELLGRGADQIDRRHPLAERQRQDAAHLGVEL